MGRILCLVGAAAIAVVSGSRPASASMITTITDVNSAVSLTCDNSSAATLAACDARFSSSVGANSITFSTVGFSNIGDWSTAFMSALTNVPGGSAATVDLSYTTVKNNSSTFESLIVEITGLGYTLPSATAGFNNMALSQSASESTGGDPSPGQTIVNTAYADDTNSGLHTNPVGCTMTVSNNTSCGSPTIGWSRADPFGPFSLTSKIQFNLLAGQDVNGSQNLVAGSSRDFNITALPEPGSILLLGSGLLGLGRAARRRVRRKA